MALHSYRPMPYNFRDAVHGNLAGNWEAAFAAPDSNDDNRSAGVALEAYGHHLYGETPLKIASSGGHSNSLDTDFLAMAGKSADDAKINVRVSYYETTLTNCPLVAGLPHTLNLNINNLPWGNADFTWQRWVHTSTSSFRIQFRAWYRTPWHSSPCL
ncbi:MAG TPA: hypothetical protein EYQ60_05500 [Myxococcales bacterium]|nr:hypothetical protein [Myxococcales bacterium]